MMFSRSLVPRASALSALSLLGLLSVTVHAQPSAEEPPTDGAPESEPDEAPTSEDETSDAPEQGEAEEAPEEAERSEEVEPPEEAEPSEPAAPSPEAESEAPEAESGAPDGAMPEVPEGEATQGPEGPGPDPLDTVIVAGTRRSRAPGSVQVIGQKQLDRLDLDDPHEVLRQAPGVFVREEDGTGLRPNIAMRGVNPDRSKKVTLMEDGILLGPAPYSAPAAYYFPLLGRMTQVRVIKGPGSVVYGPQTVAGAIDLITRPIPTGPSALLDISGGQYGYNKVHGYAGVSNDQFGFLLEGIHLGNGGFKTLPDDASTGAARDEWTVKGSYLLDPNAQVSHEFSAKLGYSQESSNETYLGLSAADFDQDPNQRYPSSALDRMDNHRTSVALSHELKDYRSNLELKTTLYRNDFSRSWNKFNRLGGADAASVLQNPDDPQNAAYYGVLTGESNTSGPSDTLYIGPNQRKYVSQGVFVRFRRKLSTGPLGHEFEAGIRLHNDSIDREHSEQAYAMLQGELYPLDEAEIRTTSNRGETFAGALHVTDSLTWKRFTLTPGLRLEAIHSYLEDYFTDTRTERSDVVVLPGAGLYVALTEDFGALAGVHRGFSPPPPGTSDDVTSELSVNYEAGLRYAAPKTKAEVVGFFNDYKNLTDVCTFSSGCDNQSIDTQFSAGRAAIYGLESLFRTEFDFGEVKLPLSLVHTLSYGKFQTSFDSADPIYGSVEEGDEMPYLPRNQLRAEVDFEYKIFGAYGVFTYISPVREVASSEPLSDVLSTDPVYKLDLGVSAQVHPMLQLYAHARNVLDYQGIVSNRPYGARPNAPRWIMLGAELKL